MREKSRAWTVQCAVCVYVCVAYAQHSVRSAQARVRERGARSSVQLHLQGSLKSLKRELSEVSRRGVCPPRTRRHSVCAGWRVCSIL